MLTYCLSHTPLKCDDAQLQNRVQAVLEHPQAYVSGSRMVKLAAVARDLMQMSEHEDIK